jgi:hypothetical protein
VVALLSTMIAPTHAEVGEYGILLRAHSAYGGRHRQALGYCGSGEPLHRSHTITCLSFQLVSCIVCCIVSTNFVKAGICTTMTVQVFCQFLTLFYVLIITTNQKIVSFGYVSFPTVD